MQGARLAGLLLIAVGTGLLVTTLTDVGGEVLLGALGLAFLISYADGRTYGLLIPGAILTGLALGVGAASLGAPEPAAAVGLGAGFLAIAVVDRLRAPGRPGWWWPLIPGGILTVTGTGAWLGLDDPPAVLVPLALIAVGVALLLGRRGRSTPGAARSSRADVDAAPGEHAGDHDDVATPTG